MRGVHGSTGTEYDGAIGALSGASLARLGIVLCSTVGLTGAHYPVDIADRRAVHADAGAAASARDRAASQNLPYYAYDSSWTFVRIRTNGGYGRFGRGYGGWAHDYPAAEIHFSRILREVTEVRARLVESGGNVLTFDDPRLLQFPIAYVSEPDEWRVTESEARGLRAYLLKGGFVIFDDFFDWEMANLVTQMRRVFPELEFLPLDGTEPLWDSFFAIEPLKVVLEGPRKNGTPRFWGLFEDNDKRNRLLAIAGAGADIGDLWEWSDQGWYPLDPTSEAFKIGVNYIIYALSH